MKISYDQTTDSLYIHLSDRVSVDSDEVRDGVVLDVDSGNAPAYHIYQKLGFCVTFQVDYFRAPVRAG